MNINNNCFEGKLDIVLSDETDNKKLKLQWCNKVEKDQKITGFKCSFLPRGFMPVTPLASEAFLYVIIYNLMTKLNIKEEDLVITNSWVDIVPALLWFPPDLEIDPNLIEHFIQKRMELDGALKSLEENSGLLTNDLINFCQEHGILDDFLSIYNVQSGSFELNFQGEKNE